MMSTPLPVLLGCVLLASTGCVSSKYKSASEDFPTPVALNVSSAPLAPDADRRAIEQESLNDQTSVPPTHSATAAGSAVTANPIRLTAQALGIVFLNKNRGPHIEEDFDRHRPTPPVILTRGQMGQGNPVVRVAPRPHHVVPRDATGDQPLDSPIALAPLARPHLKASTAAEDSLP